ncbi:MAG: CRISPR-associated helicase Cas3' [Endomicrobiia bacterium]
MNEIFSHPGKPLKEHLKNVAEMSKYIVETTPIFFQENMPIDKNILKEISYIIGFYHDVGKATIFFQEYLKEENIEKKEKLKNKPETKHSLISAIATYLAVEELLNEKKYKFELKDFLLVSSFVIVRRHHTDLFSILDDLKFEEIQILKTQTEKFAKDYLSFIPYWDKVCSRINKFIDSWPLSKFKIYKLVSCQEGILYILFHFLFSVLIDADKSEAVVGEFIKRGDISINIIDEYKIKRGYNYSSKEIDKYRNEIHKIVISQFNHIDLYREHIFSLTAPTGSGKTLISLDFAIKLRSIVEKNMMYKPRIIYVLPFLSIIDQNAKLINEILKNFYGDSIGTDIFLIHHHLSDYNYKTVNTEYEIDESEVLIDSWASEMIITTFVQFFHTIFSNRNKAIIKFNKFLGSIVILDEIQTFPTKYWLLFERIANQISKYFNTYFILCTATQPAIFDNCRELLNKKEDFFKKFNRTQIYLNIKNPITICDLSDKILNELRSTDKSILVVLNTIKSATDLYKKVAKPLKELGYEVYYLSSYVIPLHRLERIKKIKESKNKKVVISTQLIEAGVDIDLQKVIRDLGPMDSINQVSGRANRNFDSPNIGEVEIVLLKDDIRGRFFYSYIYDPVLIDTTEELLNGKEIIYENEFLNLIDRYYNSLKKRISNDESEEYYKAIKFLDYEKIGEFKLIEEEKKLDIFIELNDYAKKIWHKFLELNKITNLFDRRKEFRKIRNEFYNFVISPSISSFKKITLIEIINGIGYISNSQLQEFYDSETGLIVEDACYII